MNKFGFISWFLTLVLFLLQFIPLGIYYGYGGDISTWLRIFLGISKNPWFNYHTEVPIELFYYKNQQIFLWGIVNNGNLQFWYGIHFLTFVFLFPLTLLVLILTLIGCYKDNQTGQKLMNFNFYALLIILLYCIIGIPIYSKDILGTQIGFMDIFFYLKYGFYLLLIDFIIASIAKVKHPIE